MKTLDEATGLRILCMLAFVACMLSVCDAKADATEQRESDLTRMLIAENGWTHRTDHAAMLHAIHLLAKRDARCKTVQDALRLHIPWWRKGYPHNKKWVAGIDVSCEKPAHWPTRLRWEGLYQNWCVFVVARVRAYYAGKLPNPCKGTPDQWRARGRASRKARRLYFQIGCGRESLHNWFDTRRTKRVRRSHRKKGS